MSAVEQSFDFGSEPVRVYGTPDAPEFVAADVARILGYAQAKDMTRSLDDEEKGRRLVPTPSGATEMGIITESGLYQCIMQRQTGRMSPEQADWVRRFQRWVTREVLPTIRRTGGYEVQPTLPQSYAEALRELATEVERRELLEAKVEADAPKVAYVDQFVARDDCRTIGDFAKSIGVAEKTVREELLTRGWIYKKFIGERFSVKEQRKVEEWEYRGAADHKEKFRLFAQHNAPRHHNNQLRQTLYVTPYGCERIARLFGNGDTGPHLVAVA